MRPIEVGVLGGTGMVGQHFIRFLEGHPWFKLTWLGASDRSAGKKFTDATQWRLDGEPPSDIRDSVVNECNPKSAPKLVFSAMDASVATEIEQALRAPGTSWARNSGIIGWEPNVLFLLPKSIPVTSRLFPF